ncbi:MAG: CPBP family intramembrane glutamic endopeptidase [Flavobacteriaceae bacterium]
MKQLSLFRIVLYHFYPGILLTIFFIIFTPLAYDKGIPPQIILLGGIPLIIVPTIYLHLKRAKRRESKEIIKDLFTYNEQLHKNKLILYTLGLIIFAFIIYGITQPLNTILEDKLLYWLPKWYNLTNFQGYSKKIITITLILNLILNGLVAPYFEEIYFRGYLLPRMKSFGKFAPFLSAILFSIYHFWQPQIYLTLIVALIPMIYMTWKTRSLKLAISRIAGLTWLEHSYRLPY